ncbi:hypothetical protein BDZ94DRAFT_1303028 [Collybia nuda]|uniref:Uncharacterized protein n=1 Tax=Collybia nuda TaxID=64659 RepID=A0A9P5XRE1_9AGAR|nr:hypothetical protein BDZ94DRAFT_1303028 [Collybia nuda]
MLIPLIADMVAVRQVIGLPVSTTAHYFCEWPLKDASEFRLFATLWKEAQSETHQKEIFQAFGIWWSALLDLPYWNPVLYSVIDSMHALDLNLFQNHICNIFKINLDKPGIVKEKLPKHVPQNKLVSLERRVLYTFCAVHKIIADGHQLVVGTRWVLAKNIIHWHNNTADPAVQEFLHSTGPATAEIPDYDSLYEDGNPDLKTPSHPNNDIDVDSADDEAAILEHFEYHLNPDLGENEPVVNGQGLAPDLEESGEGMEILVNSQKQTVSIWFLQGISLAT